MAWKASMRVSSRQSCTSTLKSQVSTVRMDAKHQKVSSTVLLIGDGLFIKALPLPLVALDLVCKPLKSCLVIH